jgi:hypothetical protein
LLRASAPPGEGRIAARESFRQRSRNISINEDQYKIAGNWRNWL